MVEYMFQCDSSRICHPLKMCMILRNLQFNYRDRIQKWSNFYLSHHRQHWKRMKGQCWVTKRRDLGFANWLVKIAVEWLGFQGCRRTLKRNLALRLHHNGSTLSGIIPLGNPEKSFSECPTKIPSVLDTSLQIQGIASLIHQASRVKGNPT